MVLNSYFQRNKANHILEYMVGWRKSLYIEKKKGGGSDSRLGINAYVINGRSLKWISSFFLFFFN